MKVTREDHPQREALLNIEVEGEELEKHLEIAYHRVVQRVLIPGFRKGKAPRRVVEQRLGREHLLTEALDSLVPDVTSQAIQDQKLEAVGRPKIELAQLEPVIIKARVALKPEVDLGGYANIRMEEEKVQISDQQVEDVVNRLQRDLAPWEPVKRMVQLDDLVNMDVQASIGDKQILNSPGVDYIPQAGSQTPIPGFAEALVGVQSGETKEFTLTVPDDQATTDSPSKTYTFTATVNEVKEKKLPPLDDEFAKSVSEGKEVDSLPALKEHIHQQLTQEEQTAADHRYGEQVVKQMVAGATVTMSDLLPEYEVEHLIQEQQNALRQRRLTMEDYLKTVGKDEAQLQEDLWPTAQERLKQSLVLRKVAEVEGLEVSEEEIRKETDSLASEMGEDTESMRKVMDSQDGKDSLKRLILSRKTTQRLIEIARGGRAIAEAQQKTSLGRDTAPEASTE